MKICCYFLTDEVEVLCFCRSARREERVARGASSAAQRSTAQRSRGVAGGQRSGYGITRSVTQGKSVRFFATIIVFVWSSRDTCLHEHDCAQTERIVQSVLTFPIGYYARCIYFYIPPLPASFARSLPPFIDGMPIRVISAGPSRGRRVAAAEGCLHLKRWQRFWA